MAIDTRMAVKEHWLIVVYTVEDDVIKIVTVMDTLSDLVKKFMAERKESGVG